MWEEAGSPGENPAMIQWIHKRSEVHVQPLINGEKEFHLFVWCRNKVHSSWLFEVDVNFLAVIWSDSDLGQMLPGFTWRDLGSRAQQQYDMCVCGRDSTMAVQFQKWRSWNKTVLILQVLIFFSFSNTSCQSW